MLFHPLHKADKFIIPSFLTTGVVLAVLYWVAVSNSETSKDTKRYPLAQMLLTISILGTAFSLLLIKIKLRTRYTLIIAGILCFFPLIIMLFQYFSGSLTFKALVFEAGLSCCFFWSFLMRLVTRVDLQPIYIKACVPMVLCVSIPLLCLGVPFFVVLTTQNIEYSDLVGMIKFEAFTILFSVTMTFSWLHVKYYYIKSEDLDGLEQDSFFKKHPSLNKLPGVIIYLLLIAICLYCTINSINYIEDKDFSAGLYLNIIYLFASPLMVIIGTVISRLNFDFGIKINLLAIIFGLITSSVFLGLYLNYPEYRTIFGFFLLLPSFSIVFWAYLSTIIKKAQFVWIFSFLCLYIAFPVCFLLPFGLFGSFVLIAVYVILVILLLFPAMFLISYLINYIKSFCQKDKYERTQILKNIKCYESSLLLITILFILSEGTLLYMYLTAENSSSATGAILSMLIIICLIYIVSSISMQVKMTKDTFQKLSIVFVVVFTLLALISGILSATLSEFGLELTSGCISGCISCLFLLLISIGLIYLKYSFREHSVILMVICNLFMWIFIVLPLGVGLPSALSRATSTKRRNKLIGAVTVFLGIIFMVAVSIISIIYNIYKKKIEDEKHAINCCNTICNKLKTKKIKCDKLTARQFYDRYFNKKFEEKAFKENIENDKYFGLEELNNPNNEKYKKEFFCNKTSDSYQNKKDTVRNLTIFEHMSCFDKNDYKDMNDAEDFNAEEDATNEVVEEIEIKTKKSIEEIDIDELDELQYDEFTKIKPYKYYKEYNFSNTKIPGVKIPKKEFNSILIRDRRLLKIDKSMRNDWLGTIFDIVSCPPDTLISSNWMPESYIFSLLRYGGINTVLMTDRDIRLLYFNLTMKNLMRPLTKSIFINEFIQELANIIFPTEDYYKREIKLIVYYLYDNLLTNFNKLSFEIEDKSIENDSYRQNLIQRRPKDIRCSDRVSLNNYRILDSSDENQSIKFDKQSAKTTVSEQTYKIKSLTCEKLYNYFLSKGIMIEKCFQKKGNFIEDKLRNWNKLNKNNPENFAYKDTLDSFEDVTKYMIKKINKLNSSRSEKDEFKASLNSIDLKIPSNLISIVTKILEIIQLSSIGLKKEVNWKIFQSPLAKTSNALLIENSPYFLQIFWSSFCIAIIYAPIAYRAKKEIDNNMLQKGLKKSFIQIVGSLSYMSILKSQLSVFACNINEEPPVLWYTNIVCYESLHIPHLFCALGCLFFYYPIATFIYPMLQFNDKTLQIRFHPTFTILSSQIKLIITGITVFLPYQLYLMYQLIFASIGVFILFVYVIIKNPCTVIKGQIWMSAGYFIAFLANFLGLINLKVGGSMIVNIIFFILIGITLLIAVIAHCLLKRSKKVEQEPSNN